MGESSMYGFAGTTGAPVSRSEEHTSELQSQSNLVCRLLLEKNNNDRHAPCLALFDGRVDLQKILEVSAAQPGRACFGLLASHRHCLATAGRPSALQRSIVA